MPPPQSVQRGGRGWLHVLWIGVVLFIIATVVMFFTGNLNLYPTVILIGNFLVPVVFVAFLYDHQHLSRLSLETIGQSFVIGGILGVLGASVLESLLLPTPTNPDQGLSLSGALLVGLIEEGCKIAVVVFLTRRMRHTTQMDGLLLGAAVGMGFAALESTGYAFTALLTSRHIGASIVSTVLRGLFAPFGHGTWTGILGAVLFRESGPRHYRITGLVILTYLFVSVIHGLWDGLPLVIAWFIILPPGIPISVVTLVLSVIGVAVLAALYRRALQQRLYQFPPTNI
jgi:RsiW-degrading membrane proteinase PrsW (M82 family)